jgi:hypothetical protein
MAPFTLHCTDQAKSLIRQRVPERFTQRIEEVVQTDLQEITPFKVAALIAERMKLDLFFSADYSTERARLKQAQDFAKPVLKEIKKRREDLRGTRLALSRDPFCAGKRQKGLSHPHLEHLTQFP